MGEGRAGGGITELMRALADVAPHEAPFARGLPEGASVPVVEELPGRYQLLGELGRGGQSVVHLAFDAALGRQVAFKQRRAGGPNGQGGELLASELRFVREARITAQLDHPGIAPIHEVGRRADGSLYVTQKVIRGATLADALAARPTLEARLELLPAFLAACQAVASAHARGVIHRDLKPQNVMLGELGEVVVLDWGLARTLDGPAASAAPATQAGPRLPATDETMVTPSGSPVDSLLDSDQTVEGHVFGTPQYMSPEQAEGAHAEVDERADVFALGVVLHELLTGRRPFGGAGPGTAAWRAGPPAATPLRSLEPAAPPALAAVAERALALRPADRYRSAGDLAQEVSRYLSGRLVRAHEYTPTELLARWARRHAAILATVTAALVLLGVTSGLAVRRIVAERDRANLEARTAERVSGFLTRIFQVSDPSESRGQAVTAHELLDKAAADVEKELAEEPELQARLMLDMSHAYHGLGLGPEASRLVQRAVQLRRQVLGPEHPQTLAAARDQAGLLDDEGRYAEAEAAYREILPVQRRLLGDGHPDTLATLGSLASVLFAEGRYAESEKASREALAGVVRNEGPDGRQVLRAKNLLAIALHQQGKTAEAAALLRDVLEGKRRVYGPDHPSTLKSLINLGAFQLDTGDAEAALGTLRELVAVHGRILGAEHPDTLQSRFLYTVALQRAGRNAEAEGPMRELLAAHGRVHGLDHPETMTFQANLALTLAFNGKYQEAERLARQAVDQLRRRLGPGHDRVASAELGVAGVLALAGRRAEALDHLEAAQGIGISASDRAQLPTSPEYAPLRGEARFQRLLAAAPRPAGP